MPVFVVANPKGGAGKSTLATNLAACLAQRGHSVMLGDVDRQPSTTAWLRRRAAQKLAALPITGRSVDPRQVLRAPPGVSHTVIDTPGGLHGLDLARLLMFADVVLMPVCHAAFDRESAAACFEELGRQPRVNSGRCKVAAIGMRIDSRTRGEHVLGEWAGAIGLPLIGVLRETQNYVRCVERGLSIFDLPAARVQTDIDQWQPILAWMDAALAPPADASTATGTSGPSSRPPSRAVARDGVPRVEPQRVWSSAEVQRETIAALARKAVPQPQPQPQSLGRLWAWLVPARASVRRAR